MTCCTCMAIPCVCGAPYGWVLPPKFAEGTGARRYQPVPGDLAELKHGGPKHVKGSRLVIVQSEARGHGVHDQWWVRAPGEEADWCVDVEGLDLARRPA